MIASVKDYEKEKDTSVTGLTQGLRQQSLKAAGAGFIVADSALITSGVLAGKYKEASAGIFGLTAGFVGARYGNPTAERQLEQMYRKLGPYLRKQNVEIPEIPTAEALSKDGGLLSNIESSLYENPSQVMNLLYSVIGVQFVRSGIQHNSSDMKKSGGLLIAGALAGLLIQEKKPDPEHPPEGAVQKAWSWIQEKPLRLTGTLFTANQFFLAKDALREKAANPGKNSYMFKLIAVASFVFGNTMMALTSKAHGGGNKMDEETLSNLSDTCTRIIAAQPPEVQTALIEHIAGYLADQPNVGMKASEISTMLREKMQSVAKTHAAEGWQGRVQASVTPSAQPAL
jgi:hypothetical protein